MAFVEPVMDHWSVLMAYTYPLSLADHSQHLESVSGLKMSCLDWDSNPVPTSLETDDLTTAPLRMVQNKSVDDILYSIDCLRL